MYSIVHPLTIELWIYSQLVFFFQLFFYIDFIWDWSLDGLFQ
jgi:hypothetical protein